MIRRLWSLRPSRRGLLHAGQYAAVLACGWLFAREALGEPVRSRTALVLLMLFAWAAGRMWEVSRPHGLLDLHDRLEAVESAAARAECTGRSNCVAPEHVHGCFADFGSCDKPADHWLTRRVSSAGGRR